MIQAKCLVSKVTCKQCILTRMFLWLPCCGLEVRAGGGTLWMRQHCLVIYRPAMPYRKEAGAVSFILEQESCIELRCNIRKVLAAWVIVLFICPEDCSGTILRPETRGRNARATDPSLHWNHVDFSIERMTTQRGSVNSEKILCWNIYSEANSGAMECSLKSFTLFLKQIPRCYFLGKLPSEKKFCFIANIGQEKM